MYRDFKGDTWEKFRQSIQGKKLVIFGYGDTGKRVINDVKNYALPWDIVKIVDNDYKKFRRGANVEDPDTLKEFSPDKTVVLICSNHVGEIANQLENTGLYDYYSYLWLMWENDIYIRQDLDANEVDSTRCLFCDEESKILLDKIVQKRRDGFMDYTDIRSWYKSEYFLPEFFSPNEREVFVDGGAYDGDSIEEFAEWTKGNFEHIWSFEPQANLAAKVKKELWKYGEKVDFFQKGLWSKSGSLNFQNGDAKWSGHIADNGGDTSVQVCALDEVVNGRVTFIKMDIEGAETEAIKGAQSIILDQKPRLAICVYHKPSDLLEIPQIIHDMVPEYKLSMRHFGMRCFGTILYAYF